jgi:hypothetical protein
MADQLTLPTALELREQAICRVASQTERDWYKWCANEDLANRLSQENQLGRRFVRRYIPYTLVETATTFLRALGYSTNIEDTHLSHPTITISW